MRSRDYYLGRADSIWLIADYVNIQARAVLIAYAEEFERQAEVARRNEDVRDTSNGRPH